MGGRFWCRGGVRRSLPHIFLNLADWPLRRPGSQGPLHMRPVLRVELGSHHRLRQPVPVVLPGVLRMHDHAPRDAGYPALPEQVWGGVGRVREAGSIFVYSGECCLHPVSSCIVLCCADFRSTSFKVGQRS